MYSVHCTVHIVQNESIDSEYWFFGQCRDLPLICDVLISNNLNVFDTRTTSATELTLIYIGHRGVSS